MAILTKWAHRSIAVSMARQVDMTGFDDPARLLLVSASAIQPISPFWQTQLPNQPVNHCCSNVTIPPMSVP